MRKTNAFSTNDMDTITRLVDSDLYVTAVATRHKINAGVLDILPGILDSLQEMLDNKVLDNKDCREDLILLLELACEKFRRINALQVDIIESGKTAGS